MPPKKTKPNEKCHCGSGKKYKKCCMVANQLGGGGSGTASTAAPSPPTAILGELMAALSLTTTAVPAATATTTTATATIVSENSPCFHGSTSDHFPDGCAYSDVVKELLSTSQEVIDFVTDHGEYFTDLNFSQYLFALCTSWYLKTKRMPPEIKSLLTQAVRIKYLYEPTCSERSGCGPGPDHDKLNRYLRAIMTSNNDRGVVNCLSRETKSYCNCMKDKKKEVKGMDKTEFCVGCKFYFPRDGMLKCNACNYAMFCTKGCYAKYLPVHKEKGCINLKAELAKNKT